MGGNCSCEIRNISDIIRETLFHNGQLFRDCVRKIYEGMISTSPFGTLGLIASCEQKPSIKEIMIEILNLSIARLSDKIPLY